MNGPLGLKGVTYGFNYSIPNNAQSCAEANGLDFSLVQSCYDSDIGKQLLHDSHFQTMRLFEQHGGYNPPGHGYRPPLIPVIWIGGKQYNNPLDPAADPYTDLKKKVCELIPPEHHPKDGVCNRN